MSARQPIDPAWWNAASVGGVAMREALAGRDVKTVFNFLHCRGWSWAAIAQATDIGEQRVREIAGGKRRIESYDVYVRVAVGLKIPRDYLGVGLHLPDRADGAAGTIAPSPAASTELTTSLRHAHNVTRPAESAEAAPEHSGGSPGEIVSTYPNRASVPRETWIMLLAEARERIDVLVFSGTFFAQSNPHVARMLAERASSGVRVRLCFGDPAGRAVDIRGIEEGIGDSLAAKVRASLTYYRALLAQNGCEVRLHDTTLYNSFFRYDDDVLVNPHIFGQPASANPMFHLRRTVAEGWFDSYASGFEIVWAEARPWTPTEETAAHGEN